MYGRITEASLRMEHRHNDGTWGRLEPMHHDSSAHDPERDWAKGKIIYSCSACDEMVRIDDPSKPHEPEAG